MCVVGNDLEEREKLKAWEGRGGMAGLHHPRRREGWEPVHKGTVGLRWTWDLWRIMGGHPG